MGVKGKMVSLLLLFAFIRCVNSVSGVNKIELLPLSLKKLSWTKTQYPVNCRFFSQKSRTVNGATILQMKHHDSCSGTVQDWNKKLQNRLIADIIRFKSMQYRIRNMVSTKKESISPKAELPLNSGIKLQTLNYIVTVTLGGRNLTVIVDTGSDLSWVQCQPCQKCYTQVDPVFNPLLSPSYKTVQCSSQACQSLEYAIGNSGLCGTDEPKCRYAVSYGDGSSTSGNLGKDKLVLGDVSVENFIFGCGYYNKGLFGATSGLMGLGRSQLSLISQTSNFFDGVFSYCLPVADNNLSGSLILGSNTSVFKNTTPISYTNLVLNSQFSSFYILNMTGATIGGVELQCPSFGNRGILIDSGTVITRLPPSIYTAVKDEFLRQFTGYPFAAGFSILDTCFNLTGYQKVNVPTMKMRFQGGAEMSVDVSGMLYFVKRDSSQVCLALASLGYEDENGIIGNYQQRNIRVVYDTKNLVVGFAREMCRF